MKADLTQNTFDPFKHFSMVLMQQGRVQLDADWNDQAAILLRLVRRLAADIIGPDGTSDNGFEISKLSTTASGVVSNDFLIGAGGYYVDGILCELDSTSVPIVAKDVTADKVTVDLWTVDEAAYQTGQYVSVTFGSNSVTAKIVASDYASMTLTLDALPGGVNNNDSGALARLTTFMSQPDYSPSSQLAAGSYQVYLDVWERLITCLEDDSIREVALNGPDTAARARVVWQVKCCTPAGSPEGSCMTPQALANQLQPWNRGFLKARVQPTRASTDPCIVSPTSAYYGPENQLYRVEVNTGSNDPSGRPPTFKWSRENGAVIFPILKLATGSGQTTVTLGNLGRDDRFGLVEGDYVEVQDDDSVLNNAPGMLLQVQSIDSSSLMVVLSGTTGGTVGTNLQRHPLLRRWDQKAGDPSEGGLQLAADNAVPIPSLGKTFGATQTWLNLEDGVQIAFVGIDAQTVFRTGDYWWIPARVATGNVIWPTETATDAQGNVVVGPVAKAPDGVTHHYAPLAVVAIPEPGAVFSLTPCWATFTPLAHT
ncbi:MAG: DUF6519 domain-containing protein [Candidatus Cybelea sp.]